MDKNAIKKYAVWARNELIARVAQKANQYGITEAEIISASEDSIHGRLLTPAEKKQRTALIARIKSKEKNGYQQVIEEVAYTWFNRLTAIRFMEVNGYLPSHVRVFTDEENRFAPQILAEAIHLEMPGLNMEKVYELKQANKTEELYKYLLITQCNALNEILPGMFQKIEDYTELLLPDNLLREGSVIEQMISLIPEEYWTDQVQIIGWLYQYYNSEPKEIVFEKLKKNIKITKENIPAATQLFTPDWIVRYMVENSLGRLWVEGHPNDELKSNWKYYLEEAKQEESVKVQLEAIRHEFANIKPEEITVIDPCMGSGHILCYMFDVLVQIYESYGYTARDAASSIVENNIFGLDIDDRAAQLSYFAVMMKARQYDRRFFAKKIKPNVFSIKESNNISVDAVYDLVRGNGKAKVETEKLLHRMRDAKEYGSIISIDNIDFDVLFQMCDSYYEGISLFAKEIEEDIIPLIKVAYILSKKYDVVITNPPYMGSGGMSGKLVEYLKNEYPKSKSDLFAVFMEVCSRLTSKNHYYSMITQQSWMFLESFAELRHDMISMETISNMVHLGVGGFQGVAGAVTVAFTMKKIMSKHYNGAYVRLIDVDGEEEKRDAFLVRKDMDVITSSNEQYLLTPNESISYWISKRMLDNFKHKNIGDVGETKKGILSGNNERFVRNWFEPSMNKIGLTCSSHNDMVVSQKKWFPITSGGARRKWYGNLSDVVDLENDGYNITHTKGNNYRLRDNSYYCREAVSWSEIGGNQFCVRYVPSGVSFGNGGPVCFSKTHLKLVLGLLNSIVAKEYLYLLAPTVNFGPDQIKRIPFIEKESNRIDLLVESNIGMSKADWDSFETSWDFAVHPMVKYGRILWDATAIGATMSKYYGSELPKHNSPLELCYLLWRGECAERFDTLKANEEELNRIFIEIYGLQNELVSDVAEKDVTVRKADLVRDIRSFISYAVGCMFGRYSLDVGGIAYAGGEWDESKYITFCADTDNVLPICDDDYFEDDIVGKFIKFVEVVYGKDTLDENLKFIANALGGKGTPRDVIRSYFLNDFYADHLKIYQKRPIYWQFDSGKKNGFKCLIYMHRYQPDTIARIRTDYVHEQQARYRTAIADLEQRIQVASTSERVKLTKLLQKLKDQETEIRLFEEKVHHLADQMIRIDLDDGVKHNYEIFKDVLTKIK